MVTIYAQLLHSIHIKYRLFGSYTKSALHNIPIGFKIFPITGSYLYYNHTLLFSVTLNSPDRRYIDLFCQLYIKQINLWYNGG